MSLYEKAFIYFDTNILECRHSGKALYLSQFTINPIYYEIEDLIRTMGLSDKVEICIPEIVWLELQEHLVSHFRSEKLSIESKIDSFRKSFGHLAEISCEFKACANEEEYADYSKHIAQIFLENPRVNATIIPVPKGEEILRQVIGQAINSVPPFRKVKSGSKEYTDAGFKDALIYNTILTHTGNQLGILISHDNDFSGTFKNMQSNNLKKCNDAKELEKILSEEFNVVSYDMAEVLSMNGGYLMQQVLSECEIGENAQVLDLKILSCESNEDNVCAKFIAYVNGVKMSFDITYNINANELLGVSCEIFEEMENV